MAAKPLASRDNDGDHDAEHGAAPPAPPEPAALDRLIHERMRLGIVSALAANEVM